MEDLVHSIYTSDRVFKHASRFFWPFKVSSFVILHHISVVFNNVINILFHLHLSSWIPRLVDGARRLRITSKVVTSVTGRMRLTSYWEKWSKMDVTIFILNCLILNAATLFFPENWTNTRLKSYLFQKEWHSNKYILHARTHIIRNTKEIDSKAQSQYFILPSQPAVTTLLVSWGCHRVDIQTESWAFHFLNSFVVFQSHM